MKCSYSSIPQSDMHSHITAYPQTMRHIHKCIYSPCTQPFVQIHTGVHLPQPYPSIYIIKWAHTKYISMHKTCFHTLTLTHTISSPYTNVAIYTNISPIRCKPRGLSTNKMYSSMHTDIYTIKNTGESTWTFTYLHMRPTHTYTWQTHPYRSMCTHIPCHTFMDI